MKKYILSAAVVFFSNTLWAQFHAVPCKATTLAGETCIVKEDYSEDFDVADLANFKKLAAQNSDLPWMDVIDSNHAFISDLIAGAPSIRKNDKARYNELLALLKRRPNAEDSLEAAALYLKSNPTQFFNFSNKDKNVVRNMATKLSAKTAGTLSYKHCTPNPEKYEAIMKNRDQCSNMEESMNSISLYTVLAEIAACEDYNISKVGVIETFRTRSISKDPCIVKLNDASASIGGGNIDIVANGKTHSIPWIAGHDLSGKRNDIKYWRDQLEPALQKELGGKVADRTASGNGPVGSGN